MEILQAVCEKAPVTDTTPAASPAPDPSGVKAAIDRYRELAKNLVAIFAAIGALLAAGTQLSSLGDLTWADHKGRLLAAAGALLLALVAVAFVIRQEFRVLKPVEISLDEAIADQELTQKLVAGAGPPYDSEGLMDLRRRVVSRTSSEDEIAAARADVELVLGRAALIKTRDAFGAASVWMLLGAFVAAAAVAAFAYLANPPKAPSPPPAAVVMPSPVPLTFSLSKSGRDKLRDELGKQCVKHRIRAVSIGGKQGAPVVVVLPTRRCTSQQFTLTSALGVPDSSKSAPRK